MKRLVIAVSLAGLILPSTVSSAATKKPAAKKKPGATTTAAPATTAAPPAAAPTTAAAAAAPEKAKCPGSDNTVRILLAYEGNQGFGQNYRRGVEMSTSEINKAGGILGCKIVLDEQDTQNVPDKSKQIIAKGLESKPFVILGTVASGSTIVNMIESQRAKIAQFTGGEAASLTDRARNGNNDFIFRSSFTQSISFPRAVPMIKDLGYKKLVVVYANNEFGIGGRDATRKLFGPAGLEVVKEIAGQQGQTDFSAEVAQANGAGADAIFLYMNEAENAQFLKENARQGGKLPFVGETTLTNSTTTGLASAAAEGVVGHVGLSSAVPAFAPFVKNYLAFHKISDIGDYPDHNSLKGYIIVSIVKEMAERQNGFDSERVAKELHCAKITTKDEPGILLDVQYDGNGDIDRPSYVVKVKNAIEVLVKTLPADGGKRPGC